VKQMCFKSLFFVQKYQVVDYVTSYMFEHAVVADVPWKDPGR